MPGSLVVDRAEPVVNGATAKHNHAIPRQTTPHRRAEEDVAQLAASLKFQITLGLVLIIGLFTLSTLYSMQVIEAQRSDDLLVRVAGHLQVLEQQLTMQAMQYEENAPRDYPSYYRDLKLYYASLQHTRKDLDAIIGAFVSGDFSRVPDARQARMEPGLSPSVRDAAKQLAGYWHEFSTGLDERLGPDRTEPRLEWAAQWIVARHTPLAEAAQRLVAVLEQEVEARSRQATLVGRVLVGLALIGSVAIAGWFLRRVIRPLALAADGFHQVANGDFAHRVPVLHADEIGSMAGSFNELSARLDTLRRLLTQLERGGNLDDALARLSTTLPALLPVDWIGVLIRGSDGRFRLERAYGDGRREQLAHMAFDPDGTLLADCIDRRRPLHIPDLDATAESSPRYVFLRELAGLGRRDAVFLPIDYGGNVAGVAVFATRVANSYDSGHLALIDNLGALIGIGLARTWHIAENTRLAHIGQFASGIVHEVRNPLATIALALEHLGGLDEIGGPSRRRLSLAIAETARLERLLTDILAYAKPTALQLAAVDIDTLLEEVVTGIAGGRVSLAPGNCGKVEMDIDRMRQVLLNLVQNALDAATGDGTVSVASHCDGPFQTIAVHNTGGGIDPATRERLFEPFFTTKPTGTGLGLPLARRIVESHGGRIDVTTGPTGTTFTVQLPRARANTPRRSPDTGTP